MMLEAGLVGARFIHFTCTIVLFGGAAFGLYSDLPRIRSQSLVRQLTAILFAVAIGSVLSGLAWFLFSVANMGGSLAGMFDRETLWSVLSDTDFGRVWIARAVVMLVIVPMSRPGGASIASRRLNIVLVIIAAFLLASLAGIGHTRVNEGVAAVAHMTSDVVHLLSAGAWIGGLLPLGLVVASCRTRQVSNDDTVFVLSRFSGMAYLAVAALVASGAMNGFFLIDSWSALVDTSYGKLLLSKVGLLGLMLCLAASNRFWLVPALAKAPSASEPDLVLTKLHRHILAEQIVGILIVGIVSLLGTLAPAIQGS